MTQLVRASLASATAIGGPGPFPDQVGEVITVETMKVNAIAISPSDPEIVLHNGLPAGLRGATGERHPTFQQAVETVCDGE
jgi:hypothetical protein